MCDVATSRLCRSGRISDMCCVVVTQPTYLPWLGYFEQLARADVFVFLDTVQFARRSWQSRNRLKDSRDQSFWLTVPVTKQPRETALRDIRIHATENWADSHLSSLQYHLGKAPYYRQMWRGNPAAAARAPRSFGGPNDGTDP